MDRGGTWGRRYPISLNPQFANIIIQTDGGRRSDRCAVAAMVVGLSAGGHYEPWVAKGHFFEADITVFQTEAIALELATCFVTENLCVM